jgi:hypothetical protein
MDKTSTASAAPGLITRILHCWSSWRGRVPDQFAANAANHAAHPENFAGKWPDADAVLAWRLSGTVESYHRNPATAPASMATTGKQETP